MSVHASPVYHIRSPKRSKMPQQFCAVSMGGKRMWSFSRRLTLRWRLMRLDFDTVHQHVVPPCCNSKPHINCKLLSVPRRGASLPRLLERHEDGESCLGAWGWRTLMTNYVVVKGRCKMALSCFKRVTSELGSKPQTSESKTRALIKPLVQSEAHCPRYCTKEKVTKNHLTE